MGIADLREAFTVAAPGYSCARALFGYERLNGKEWQVMTFFGTKPDGQPFEIRSEMLSPGINLREAAAQVAQQLIAQQGPTP